MSETVKQEVVVIFKLAFGTMWYDLRLSWTIGSPLMLILWLRGQLVRILDKGDCPQRSVCWQKNISGVEVSGTWLTSLAFYEQTKWSEQKTTQGMDDYEK